MTKYITAKKLAGGWFANRMFKYFMLINLSKKYDLKIQTSPWIGEKIFKIDPTPIDNSIQYEDISEGKDPDLPCCYHHESSKIISLGNKLRDKNYNLLDDFNAFYHTSWYKESKDEILKLFTFKDEIYYHVVSKIDEIKKEKQYDFIIGLHVRIGDDYQAKWKFPFDAYSNLVKSLLIDLKRNGYNPGLFIATDKIEKARNMFKDLNPIFLSDFDLKVNIEWKNESYKGSLDFLPDFILLTISNYLIASDSSFSYCASMLNTCNNARFIKPSIKHNAFVYYDPWDTWLIDYRTWRFQ